MTDSAGNQVGPTVKYLPFGEARNTQQEIDNYSTNKLFTGQRLDSTGLYYYNARYYDPTIGRFISPDSEGVDYNNPQTLNRYTYCSNNPLNQTDPTGHWSWKSVLKWTAIAVAAVVVTAAVIIAAPVVLSAIATASTIVAASTSIAAVSTAALGVATATSTAAAFIAPAAAWVAAIPVLGVTATTVASVGLEGVGITPAKGAAGTSTRVNAENGFGTFRELENSIGSAGEGNQWHHIVEQCQIGKSGFAPNLIQNPDNVLAVNAVDHAQISGYYNSIDQAFSESMRVRNWLAGQSFDFQYNFGLQLLSQFGY